MSRIEVEFAILPSATSCYINSADYRKRCRKTTVRGILRTPYDARILGLSVDPLRKLFEPTFGRQILGFDAVYT
jgi:hypothetical protein